MQFLFKDYTDLVVKTYEEKRDANLLSQLLMHPTSANLRQECLNVYAERIKRGEKEEENTLKAFFGIPPAGRNFGHIIERHNPDKFRPLQSLIKREIKNPGLVTVELLAWLINFTPRPLGHAQRIFANTNEANNPVNLITDNSEGKLEPDCAELNVGGIKEAIPGTNTVNTEKLLRNGEDKTSITDNEGVGNRLAKTLKGNSQNNRRKTAALIVLIIAIFFSGMYFLLHEKLRGAFLGNVNTGCMYWAGDHYEQLPCNEKRSDRFKVPLDSEKMKNFKKITKEDTITEKSIGMIYYIRIGGNTEYYTTGGNHPVYVTRSLKVLSRYMFETHLRKKEAPDKNFLVE